MTVFTFQYGVTITSVNQKKATTEIVFTFQYGVTITICLRRYLIL